MDSLVEVELCGRLMRYQPLGIRTPDGLTLSVQVHGDQGAGRDVLFLHGFSQASLAWLKQVTGPLRAKHRFVTMDLRGHGSSSRPVEAVHYREAERWAADIETVIQTTGLVRPILVCWSYAGRVVLDYIERRGCGAIGGLVMVAATSSGNPDFVGPAGPLMRAMTDATDMASDAAAIRAFVEACAAEPVPPDEHALMLAYNMKCPPEIRRAMAGRPAHYDEVLKGVSVPLLAIHGASDAVSLVTMSAHSCACAPRAELKIFGQSGHLPFWEENDRFDAELDHFLNGIAA